MPGIDKYEILKDYCDWGWRLLPVHAEKKRPLIEKWVENATCDHQTIERWSTKVFKWANWGIACGKESGIIVIDLDEPKPDKDGNIHDIHGEVALPLLEQELGKLPVTVSQTTPGNGRHLFFKAPQDMTIHVKQGIRFFPGMAIDILSEKRQVIVSPSKRPDGYYEWVPGLSPWEIELAELPPRWIERLGVPSKKTRNKKDNVIALSPLSTDKFELPDVIGNGERNDTLFKYACSLLAKGESHDRVKELVLQADAERGNPPMQDDPDDYRELLNTIESAINTDVAGREARIMETLNEAGVSADSEQVKEALDWLIMNIKKDGTVEYDIHEPKFAEWFVKKYQLVSLNGMIYSVKTGEYLNDDKTSHMVQQAIKPYIIKNTDARVKSLFNLSKREAYTEYAAPDEFTIVTKNRTFKVGRDGTFTDIDHVESLFMFPIEYDPEAKCPRWENFINGLIPAHAIPTLQQYMGYCFIPSKRAQVSLHLIGNGQEGKSKVLDIMQLLLGQHNFMTGVIHDLFEDKFMLAQLINRYVFMDDDLINEPLKQSGRFKQWVTERNVMVQRKNVDAYQVDQFVRFFCVGNHMLRALNDTTEGWYRRLIQIRVLPKPADRVDNKFLIDELSEELPGIFNWCMQGLSDMMKNGMEIHKSEETMALMYEQRTDDDPLLLFLDCEEVITFDKDAQCTSKELWGAYNMWASANGYHTYATQRKFTSDIKDKLAARPGIKLNPNALSYDGQRARGYDGIMIHHEKKDYINGKIITLR